MVQVRVADKAEDLSDIIQGAMSFAAESGLAEYLPKSYVEFVEGISAILFLPDVTVFLAYEGDRCVGGIGLIYSRFLWNLKLRTAEELFWWTSPDAPPTAAMRLLNAAFQDAVGKADIRTFASLTTSPDKVARVYAKKGLRPVQQQYIGRV